MRSLVRTVLGFALVLGSVIAVSASWAMATAIPLLAAHTTALIMGGTGHPLVGPKDETDFVTSYLDNAVIGHLDQAFGGPATNAVAVFTPEEFFPLGQLSLDQSVAEGLANLHRCVAASVDCAFNDDAAVVPAVGPSVAPKLGDSLWVFGFSQSAVIASLAKQDLITDYEAGDPATSVMLLANPMRPNGGVLMRGKGLPTIPILGVSFTGASPTDSAQLLDDNYAYPTVDVARQYDGLGGDFPVRPLNLLALVNALLGYYLLHGETVDVPFDQARYQGREGDTSYYLIETDIVPILQPLASFIPEPILKAIDAPLRVIIEDAYDRDIGPGTPTPFSWWPINDVFGLVGDLIKSVPVAVDNLFEGFGLPRVLGTGAPGTYGVGGPDLPDDPGATPVEVGQQPQEAGQQPQGTSTSDGVGAETVESDADPITASAGAVQQPAEAAGATGEESTPAGPGADAGEPVVGADEPGFEEPTPAALGTDSEEPVTEEPTLSAPPEPDFEPDVPRADPDTADDGASGPDTADDGVSDPDTANEGASGPDSAGGASEADAA